ncbi:MAG TPA: LamG domain-containing protein [Verrucomicrobiae bacterium]
MAEFKFSCPQCGQNIQCGTGYAGTQINCPTCQKPIVVPPAMPVPPQTAPSPAIRRGTPVLAAGQQSSGAPVRAKSRKMRNILLIAAAVVVLAVLVIGGWYGYSKIRMHMAAGHLPSGVVAFWSGEGNANDSVNRNSGSLVGDVSYSTGKVGRAFSFNGAAACVNVPDAPTLNPTKALTIETWVYVTSFNPSGGVALVGKDGVYNDRQFQLGMGLDNGSWVFRPFIGVSAGLFLINGTVSIRAKTWYHVAMTFDGSRLCLFVNGQLDGSLAVADPLITSTQPLRMGGAGFGPWDFQGRLDEVGLFNRALSASEIQKIYADQK